MTLLDLMVSLIYRFINGPQNIDFQAYIQQSNYYLDDPDGADYTKLRSGCGPVAYPGAAVYIYTGLNLLSGRNATWNFAQCVHIPIDIYRTWLLVKVYKLALGPKLIERRQTYAVLFIMLQAKYKWIGVLFNFNDVVMHVVALTGIYFHLRQNQLLSILFMGFAASIKMSALLFLPGALLLQAFEYGVFRGSVIYLLGTILVQFLFGLEFILKNWRGYKEMAYDFDRNFDQSESINFHYIS